MPVNKFLISVCLGIILIFLQAIPLYAGQGSCENFKFIVDKKGRIDRTQPVAVLRDNAPVFSDSESMAAIENLSFNRKLIALGIKGSRIMLKYMGGREPLGWVENSDLLCAFRPLKGVSGLEKKLYIKTATAVQGSPQAVKAYSASDTSICPKGGCRELSRFTGYFVFDEENGKLLLGDEYHFKETSPLIGWIDRNNGFVWETAYGLRPKESIFFSGDENANGEEGTVCAYLTLEDAKTKTGCRPILGGDRWFTYPDRIPILGREGEFYKVALPLAGTGVAAAGGKEKLSISPELLGENPGIGSLQNMKKVDVFFLIDGTKSMQPYISAARKVVNLILDTLSSDGAYRETKFRFGFRVYRDTYAGNNGIGEGLRLSSRCDMGGDDSQNKNRVRFDKAMAKVMVSKDETDDYEENVFGGIRQAVRDMNPCPDNTKILFVIGDHGYNPDAQKKRGVRPVSENSLIRSLKGNTRKGVKNIVTFFMQIPGDKNLIKSNSAYASAYGLFKAQGKNILRGILGGRNKSSDLKNFFLTTGDQDLPQKVLSGVKLFSKGDVINEVILDLRGGAALVDAIERLQGSKEYKNLPGLFWDMVKDGSCKHLGEQCENKVYDTILEGYIPISDNIVEDVWLKMDDLERWKMILSLMKDISVSGISGSKQRTAFVIALTESLQQVIRDPRGIYNTGEPLFKYLTRIGGLPLRDNSPFFQYSLDSLKDVNKVPDCEISRLGTWIHNAKQMLDIVSLGTRRPVYNEVPYPGECRRSDGTPIPIPFIDGPIGQIHLGPTEKHRFDHAFQKVRIYWVPKEYLP